MAPAKAAEGKDAKLGETVDPEGRSYSLEEYVKPKKSKNAPA